ncbi:MAG: hypothetical protein ACLUDU_15165 [Butyricimonas faecihominis]
MKKYIILSMLFTLFGLVSCYDDDSSLGTKDVGDITIGPLEDASIISYSGNKLIREPEIETTYPDDQLTYAWYIYKEDQDKGFRTNKIDSVRIYRTRVNLPAGSYTIIFEATATTNGYAATAEMKLLFPPLFAGILHLKRNGRWEHGTGCIHAERASFRSFCHDTGRSVTRLSS